MEDAVEDAAQALRASAADMRAEEGDKDGSARSARTRVDVEMEVEVEVEEGGGGEDREETGVGTVLEGVVVAVNMAVSVNMV